MTLPYAMNMPKSEKRIALDYLSKHVIILGLPENIKVEELWEKFQCKEEPKTIRLISDPTFADCTAMLVLLEDSVDANNVATRISIMGREAGYLALNAATYVKTCAEHFPSDCCNIAHRIVVTGLRYEAEDVLYVLLFERFGRISQCNFLNLQNDHGLIIEYSCAVECLAAELALNKMELKGSVIKVKRVPSPHFLVTGMIPSPSGEHGAESEPDTPPSDKGASRDVRDDKKANKENQNQRQSQKSKQGSESINSTKSPLNTKCPDHREIQPSVVQLPNQKNQKQKQSQKSKHEAEPLNSSPLKEKCSGHQEIQQDLDQVPNKKNRKQKRSQKQKSKRGAESPNSSKSPLKAICSNHQEIPQELGHPSNIIKEEASKFDQAMEAMGLNHKEILQEFDHLPNITNDDISQLRELSKDIIALNGPNKVMDLSMVETLTDQVMRASRLSRNVACRHERMKDLVDGISEKENLADSRLSQDDIKNIQDAAANVSRMEKSSQNVSELHKLTQRAVKTFKSAKHFAVLMVMVLRIVI